jgi:S1-C subfamily serine protease
MPHRLLNDARNTTPHIDGPARDRDRDHDGSRLHGRVRGRVLLVLGGLALAVLLLSGTSPPGHTQEAFTAVAESVNRKLVKVYGSGGFQGIASGGTGVLVSSQGHILTVATQMLDTRDLRVHLWDGRRLKAEVVVIEPELDLALLKIRPPDNLPLEPLEHFDISQAAQQPLAKPGDWVLAISNMFQVATREEPMSVQRGVIAAYGKLPIQRGYTEAPFAGEVYVIDAVTNNPGAAGGALVNRKGQLLGLIGRELRNRQTETWINYAIPVQAAVKVDEDGKDKLVRAVDLVELGVQGKYRPAVVTKRREGKGAYTGIVLVPSPVERTPPYIEDVLPGSPAALAKLRPDDLIVYVDGEPVNTVKAFNEIVRRTAPGTVLRLEVRRDNRIVTVDLQTTEPPGAQQPPAAQPPPGTQPPASTPKQ